MYTYNGTAIYVNVEPSKEGVLVAVATNEGRAGYIVDALNKAAYTHTHKATPQFQPWDIVQIKPEHSSKYTQHMNDTLWLVRGDDDCEDGQTAVFDPERDVRGVLRTAQLELVERLADRKARG